MGNYNEKTSRLYTDLSYITARDEIGEEALQVFQALMLGETVDHMSVLLVAPHCLQDKLIDMIDGEISKAKAGQKGLIRLKMNSLTDKMLIDKLVEASQAGVQVEMIVRGICCLRGGVPGLTDMCTSSASSGDSSNTAASTFSATAMQRATTLLRRTG